jgi:hypothetical protein
MCSYTFGILQVVLHRLHDGFDTARLHQKAITPFAHLGTSGSLPLTTSPSLRLSHDSL